MAQGQYLIPVRLRATDGTPLPPLTVVVAVGPPALSSLSTNTPAPPSNTPEQFAPPPSTPVTLPTATPSATTPRATATTLIGPCLTTTCATTQPATTPSATAQPTVVVVTPGSLPSDTATAAPPLVDTQVPPSSTPALPTIAPLAPPDTAPVPATPTPPVTTPPATAPPPTSTSTRTTQIQNGLRPTATPRTRGSVAPAPGGKRASASPARARRAQGPRLRVSVPRGIVTSNGTIAVAVQTTPRTRVVIDVRLTRVTYATHGVGRQRKRVARVTTLFATTVRTTTDAKGQATRTVRLRHKASRPITATLLVAARIPQGTTTWQARVTA